MTEAEALPPPSLEAKAEPEVDSTFKVAEVREDGTVVVAMEDGRMFTLPVFEGDKPRKGSKIDIACDGLDKEGVPINPVAKLL